MSSQLLECQGKGHHRAEEHHGYEIGRIVAGEFVYQHFFCRYVIAVPGRGELGEQQVGPGHGDDEGQLAGLLQNGNGHVFLKAEEVTQDDEQGDNGRAARI